MKNYLNSELLLIKMDGRSIYACPPGGCFVEDAMFLGLTHSINCF